MQRHGNPHVSRSGRASKWCLDVRHTLFSEPKALFDSEEWRHTENKSLHHVATFPKVEVHFCVTFRDSSSLLPKALHVHMASAHCNSHDEDVLASIHKTYLCHDS